MGKTDSPPYVDTCSICLCPIERGMKLHRCSACSLAFHADCWKENYGCATYGCANVNSLRQGPDISITNEAVRRSNPEPPLRTRSNGGVQHRPPEIDLPWEYVLLGGSAFVAILSVVMFGLPAILLGVLAGYYTSVTPRPKLGVLIAVFAICGAAFLTGLVLSCLLWMS